METLKKIVKRLLFPHIAVFCMLVPVAAGLLVYAFAVEGANQYLVYFSYFLSAYTLTVVCVRIPAIINKVKDVKENNRYVNRYVTDPRLRVKLSLYLSVFMNTFYGIMQLVSGIVYKSFWFYSLAVYYFLLAIIRFFVLRDSRRNGVLGENRRAEFGRYRFCGIMLLVMNIALGGIVFFIVWHNRGFEYNFIHTIAMAAYTFASMTLAVVNVVRYRRYESPLMSAAKAISLASALVSLLSLETAMLSAFGSDEDPVFRSIMTASTGAAVCIFILGMAIYMIVRSSRAMAVIDKGVNSVNGKGN